MSRVNRVDQSVANTRHRFDGKTTSALGKLPERRDRPINYVVPDKAAAPAQGNQLVTSDDLTTILSKRQKNLQILRLQSFRDTIECRVARNGVDDRASDPDQRLLRKIDHNIRPNRSVHYSASPAIEL